MRFTRLVCIFLAALFAVSLMAKKPKDKNNYGVYLVGVSASFTDSLVYFTDVKFVDSAFLDKSDFLFGRAQYSEQLEDFFKAHNQDHRTCFVFYDKKKKHVQKQVDKLKQKYMKEGGVQILPVDASFNFKKAQTY